MSQETAAAGKGLYWPRLFVGSVVRACFIRYGDGEACSLKVHRDSMKGDCSYVMVCAADGGWKGG